MGLEKITGSMINTHVQKIGHQVQLIPSHSGQVTLAMGCFRLYVTAPRATIRSCTPPLLQESALRYRSGSVQTCGPHPHHRPHSCQITTADVLRQYARRCVTDRNLQQRHYSDRTRLPYFVSRTSHRAGLHRLRACIGGDSNLESSSEDS